MHKLCTLYILRCHYNYKRFQVNSLWIPYVIFRNTDGDEAVKVDDDQMTLVAVTRQGDFVRSGPEVADEVTRHAYLGWFLITCVFTDLNTRLRYSEERTTL